VADLLDILVRAAHGSFPSADGAVDVLASPAGRCDAVVGFTAHAVVAAAVPADEVRARLPPDDLGAAMSPAFLSWLGARLGSPPGVLDCVMVADGMEGAGGLVARDDLADHPRVQRSLRYRQGHRVYTPSGGGGVVCIGRGLADRWEVAVEVDASARGRGLGRALVTAARTLVPAGEVLFAQVSPGNAQSIRCSLAAGYRVIGSEVLFARPQTTPD
jgi:GNAT superfamily N-acetyltransferase